MTKPCGLWLLVAAVTLGCSASSVERTSPPAGPAAPVAAAQPAGRDMLLLLADIARRTPDEHPYFGTKKARELRAQVQAQGAAAPWDLHFALGEAEMLLGNEEEGIEQFTRARELVLQTNAKAEDRNKAMFYLAVAYMRLGETKNCCARPSAESCILPIRGGGLHTDPEGSREAIPYFLEVLENTEKTYYWHRAAQWLLNLAHMTLGSWPDGVPEAYRIPARAFESETDFPRFRNVAGDLGLGTFSLAGGAIADDFDGDDYIDLVVSTWDTSGQIRFWHNDRNGGFVDRTQEAGLTGLYGGLNLKQADYDNDGDGDFLVLRGAWLLGTMRHPNSLVRNNGDGTFTDVTFAAGLADAYYNTQTGDWADYDNDGDLDLYVGNEATPDLHYPGQLFQNRGDGTFTDVAREAGVENLLYAKGVTWGDYDGDRLPDLYVSNLAGPNRLYHNRGDGTFTDVASDLGVTEPNRSFPTWFWDYDNDGALDLFVSASNTGIGHITAYYTGAENFKYETMALYHNDGRGRFRNVAREAGLELPAQPMGSNYGDLDNDGWLDFYLGTGNVQFYELMPNQMFRNLEGRAFQNVTVAGGFGHLQKGHAVSFADLDQDGDLDVFEEMGGAYPGDRYADALYENPGFGNHWLGVELSGRRSNRSAIGARIRVEVEEQGASRSIWRHVTSGGSFGASPLRQHFGIARADRIRLVEVFWPATGETQIVRGVEPGQVIEIVEGQDGFRKLALDPRRFKLAGGP